MLKKDLYFFLEDFPDDIEVCFWSNGKAHPVEVVKDDKTRNCVLLNVRKEQPVEKKSNVIFDKCVENCDLAVMKEVSDNVDKILGRQPVEGLEEEIKRYFQGLWPGMETAEQCDTDMRFTPPAIMRLARHFAEWGAENLKR